MLLRRPIDFLSSLRRRPQDQDDIMSSLFAMSHRLESRDIDFRILPPFPPSTPPTQIYLLFMRIVGSIWGEQKTKLHVFKQGNVQLNRLNLLFLDSNYSNRAIFPNGFPIDNFFKITTVLVGTIKF